MNIVFKIISKMILLVLLSIIKLYAWIIMFNVSVIYDMTSLSSTFRASDDEILIKQHS